MTVPAQARSNASIRILGVEDSATQAAALSVVLERQGYDVVIAGSGEDALEVIRAGGIDLVLTDIVMPGMDGYQLCARIKAEQPDMPVILLTSLTDPLAIVRGLESGANHYVTKPYEPKQLVARVELVLRRASEGSGFTPRPVDVDILGNKFTITATKEQILELLVSSYGDLVRTSEAVGEAAQRARFLADAGVLLSESLEEERILSDLAGLITPYLADVCLIDMVGGGSEATRVEIAIAESVSEELAQEVRGISARSAVARFTRDSRSATPALISGSIESMFGGKAATTGATAGETPEALSAIAAPLVSHAGLLGVVTFISRRPYTRDDLVLATDVVMRAAIALDNARLYREAKQATRARDDVLAVVSHDLRNPLNAIQMSATFLLEMLATPDVTPPYASQLKTINRAATRANRLIGDLLDVSRIEAGTLAVEVSPYDAGQVIAEAVEDQRGLANEKELAISGEWSGEPMRIPLDRERIGQVFSNLIGNAIKFTPNGGSIAVSWGAER